MTEQFITLNQKQFDYLMSSAVRYAEGRSDTLTATKKVFKSIRRHNKFLNTQDHFPESPVKEHDRMRSEEKKLAKQLFRDCYGKTVYYQVTTTGYASVPAYCKVTLIGIDTLDRVRVVVKTEQGNNLVVFASLIIKEIPDHFYYHPTKRCYIEPTKEYTDALFRQKEAIAFASKN